MCILLVSTQHPDYPLILLSNRDEFLHRPTARAAWWDTPSTSHILSGKDLARPERGTWLGITRQGRIAVLTNYREASSAAAIGARSRGAMVNAFLTSPAGKTESTRDWVQRMLTAEGDEGVKGVGGFSLLCGTIRPRRGQPGAPLSKPIDLDPLAIISNRTPSNEEAHWICSKHDEVHGLSNSLFDDPMHKVTMGETLLRRTLDEAITSHTPENELLEKLFSILSHDTLPITKGEHTYETDLESLSHSIFIPAFETQEEKTVKKLATKATTTTKTKTTTTTTTTTTTMTAMVTSTPTPAPAPTLTPTPQSTEPRAPNGTSTSTSTNGTSNHKYQNGHLTPVPSSEDVASTIGKPNKPRNISKIIAARPANGTAEPDCFCATPATPATPPSLFTPFYSPRVYGTQKQTIILVNNEGHVKFLERTLYDENARWVGDDEEGRDTVFEFDIEGWS